jgi:hypothetical protein
VWGRFGEAGRANKGAVVFARPVNDSLINFLVVEIHRLLELPMQVGRAGHVHYFERILCTSFSQDAGTKKSILSCKRDSSLVLKAPE